MTGEIPEFRGEYSFLSNFWTGNSVIYQNIIYQSAEHAYQTQKTSNPEKKQRIMEAPTPGMAKRLGKRLSDYSDWEWRRRSIQVMTEVVRAKFQNPDLRQRLLETGDKILIEGNRHGDDFWGVVIGRGGRNHLGQILMAERDRIRTQQSKED